jgi:hypothetical protein
VILLTALSIVLAGCGYAVGALTISHVSNTAAGTYIGESAALPFWSQTSEFTTTIPFTVPPLLSTTVASPTVLSGTSGNYEVNSATAADPAVALRFTETLMAMMSQTNTEIELHVYVAVGGSPSSIAKVVYLETQAMAPMGSLTFTLYVDTGSISISHLTVTSVSQTSAQCMMVGMCP